MQLPCIIAIHGDLRQAAAYNGAGTGRNQQVFLYVPGGDPIGILSGHVESFSGKPAQRTQRLAGWLIQSRPGIVAILNEVGE